MFAYRARIKISIAITTYAMPQTLGQTW